MKSKLAAMRGKSKASGGGAKPEGRKARAKRLRAEADEAEGESGVRLPLLQNDDTLSSDDEEEKARRAKIVQRRILILSARGVVSRFRHLMNDIKMLTPHHKSDAKFSNHAPLREINEICDMKACSTCMLFESRKGKDLFLWVAKTPHGPSMKFQLQNMHTMNELNFTGNCLRGSRPMLCFDSKFNKSPELQLVKELLTQVFAAPAQHVRTQPFVDRVYSFMLADGRIWFRHYQVITPTAQEDAELAKDVLKKGADSNDLIEIGPRFVMNPIKMFAGSFGGATLFANAKYVSPNTIRSQQKKAAAQAAQERVLVSQQRRQRALERPVIRDELQEIFHNPADDLDSDDDKEGRSGNAGGGGGGDSDEEEDDDDDDNDDDDDDDDDDN